MHRRLNGTAGSELRAAFHKASNAAEPIDPKAQVRHQTLKSRWLFPPPPVEPPVRYSGIGGLRHRAGQKARGAALSGAFSENVMKIWVWLLSGCGRPKHLPRLPLMPYDQSRIG
jgi:hypothetical protein